jgi:hypothetical protein
MQRLSTAPVQAAILGGVLWVNPATGTAQGAKLPDIFCMYTVLNILKKNTDKIGIIHGLRSPAVYIGQARKICKEYDEISHLD